jgi:BlaI family transcriptional regulator, penicillinase repressor
MAAAPTEQLSKRERQAMDLLYRLGQASAQEIWEQLPDPPNYSAVRSLLTLLEEKGLVKHTRQSKKYIYTPTVSPARASKGALRRLMSTFFDDSPSRLVASLLDSGERKVDAAELAQIKALLEAHEHKSAK